MRPYVGAPLFTALRGVGLGTYGDMNYFDFGTLFWSLERLFGCYERILAACDEYARTQRYDTVCDYTAGDVEHFIIRLRVVLNDLAFVVRRQLPDQVRGLGGPKGATSPSNREFSMRKLMEFVTKHPTYCHRLSRLVELNRPWMRENIIQRDDIVHYKAKAVIFFDEDLHVGFIDPAVRSESITKRNVIKRNVREYVNMSAVNMWNMMHGHIVNYLKECVDDGILRYEPLGVGHGVMRCVGLARFAELNDFWDY